ncbi:hypothetical protein PENTCL1PPCAC_12926, partial [Pristionchus entomophagus]
SDLLFYASFAFPLIITASYGILFVFLHVQNKKTHEVHLFTVISQRQQLSFVIQFSIIAIFQFASGFFYILPGLFGNSVVVNYILTSSSALYSMANPIYMFLFQQSVRDAFFDLPIINRFASNKTTQDIRRS